MNRLVIFIVGFDEKLILRSSFKIGLKPDDSALLIYSTGSGEYEKSKVSRALETIESIFTSAGVHVNKLDISANDFGRDVATIVKVLRETNPNKAVLALGSGMRYLGFAALYALIIYREFIQRDLEIYIHIAREDGLYDVLINARAIKFNIGSSESLFICNFEKSEERDVLVKRLIRKLHKSLSTIYSLLYRLDSKGLVKIEDNLVRLTPLGEALYYSICGERGG